LAKARDCFTIGPMLTVGLCRRLRRWALPVCALCFLLSALPSEARLADRAVWRSPTAARQFSEWAATLSYLGFEVSARGLERFCWKAAKGYLAVRGVVLGPWLTVQRQLGIGQSWSLFTTPQTDPIRLVIDVETDQGWRPLFASRSELHIWRRGIFDHHRVRKLIGRLARTQDLGNWNALTEWVTGQVALDFASARRVRIALWRWQTLAPGSSLPYVVLDERGTPLRTVIRSVRSGG
jgi:hypothetical protein